ncbi:MAG: hypothetical protein J5764_00870 [Bacteroidales bacterium]|nr:hypothetical protein [Bacteroidales bacterium]
MRKLFHNLLKGLSLTAILFVFQACYGTPNGDPYYAQDEVPENQTPNGENNGPVESPDASSEAAE